MINTIPDVRALLIENLATSAARLGCLPDSEALRWAEARSTRILNDKCCDHNRLEQLCLNDLAAGVIWLRDKLQGSLRIIYS